MRAPLVARCAIALMVAQMVASSGDAAAQTQTRAATLYRCGPDGRDLRDSPCPGDSRAAPTKVEYEQPSEVDRRMAQQQHRDDKRLAHELERERRKREAEGGRQQAIGIDGLAGNKPGAGPDKGASRNERNDRDKVTKAKKPKLSRAEAPRTQPRRGDGGPVQQNPD